MKKLHLTILIVLVVCVLAGCNKGISSLKAKDIETNTILIKDDGKVQSCVVEDFGKEYYSQEELDQFIQKAISEYAKTAGEEAVQMDSLDVKEDKAKVIFNYASVKDYAVFNDVDTSVLTVEEAAKDERIPDSFVTTKSSDKVDKETALSNDEYTVVIVTEPLDVVVSGKVVYYANGLLLDNNTVQSGAEGATAIVYKK